MQDISQQHNIIPKTSKIKKMQKIKINKNSKLQCENDFLKFKSQEYV